MQTLEERLYDEGFAFDFFQAMRVLAKLHPERKRVGYSSQPHEEVVRFRPHMGVDFPASSVYEVLRPTTDQPVPLMTVTFFGLTGPSGILPRMYTEMLIRHQREGKGKEKGAFRSWLDMFNHRLTSLFYRAWQKYRFHIHYEQGEADQDEPDSFTQALYSLTGLGQRQLRNRLRYSKIEYKEGLPHEQVLAKIDDLALMYYGGILAQRPRSVAGLEQMLGDYFQLPVEIEQLRGRWLVLEKSSQTRVGEVNGEMGISLVAGERVWDIATKFRIRIGPLRGDDFGRLLPDRTPIPERKMFFLLVQLVRLYVGPEFDFDIQLILDKRDVPACQFQDKGLGARLGWNTWMCTQPAVRDAEDAVFEGVEV